jgi:hypothetical protein
LKKDIQVKPFIILGTENHGFTENESIVNGNSYHSASSGAKSSSSGTFLKRTQALS